MQGQSLGLFVAFSAGLLSFLSPCVLPLVPSYATFITGMSLDELQSADTTRTRRRVFVHGLLFVLGFTVVFLALGASATFIGALLRYASRWVQAAGGVLLILFSRATGLSLATGGLLLFGLFVHISCGATYAVIPFVNRKALGSVAGIVGAGGNVGAVLSGFLFRGAIPWPTALLLLGVLVTVSSLLTLLVPFTRRQATQDASPQPTEFVGSSIPAGAVPAM